MAMPHYFRVLGSTFVLLGMTAVYSASQVSAAEFEVKMLNRGADGTMVFEPALTTIAVGDTVTFVPTDKSHNAETIRGMVPEGGEEFKGKVNEQISVTFTVPGVYGIRCVPHYAMGMVALISVEDPSVNLEEAKAVRNPPKAKQRFDAMFAELEQ